MTAPKQQRSIEPAQEEISAPDPAPGEIHSIDAISSDQALLLAKLNRGNREPGRANAIQRKAATCFARVDSRKLLK